MSSTVQQSKVYRGLLIASLLANFADNLIGPFYAVFVQKIGGGISEIGQTTAVYSFATGGLVIAIGAISDRLNKATVTIAGYALFAFGNLMYLAITKPSHLFLLQIVFALGTACLSAPLSSLFARCIQQEQEGLKWGLESGGTHVVLGFSVLAGTLVVTLWGFRVLFLTMFALQLMAMLIQLQLFLSRPEPFADPRHEAAVPEGSKLPKIAICENGDRFDV